MIAPQPPVSPQPRRDNAHHIALKFGNDPEQHLVSPDVGVALKEE